MSLIYNIREISWYLIYKDQNNYPLVINEANKYITKNIDMARL